MAILPGLLSIAALSLFLSRTLKHSTSLMPLVSSAAAILWFALWGCVGLLPLAGWLWYPACAAALFWTVLKEKKAILSRITPGFVFFLLGSLFFICLYATTQPLFTEWDEFIFWGTASKVTVQSDALYTMVDSNLIARSAPPALIVFGYMMQFFGGGYAEWAHAASLAVLCLAAFAAISAKLDQKPAAACALLAGLFLLPLFFDSAAAYGTFSTRYLTVMADLPLAAVFGGALGLYFSGGDKNEKLLLPLAMVLAALVSIKDMGLALALLAWLIVCTDLLFCGRSRLAFFRLRRWPAWFAAAGTLLAAIGLAYLGWALHLGLSPTAVDRFNVGPGGESLSMFGMVLRGLQALLGILPHERYSLVLGEMFTAFFRRPVSLIGPGARVFIVIFAVLVCAWLLSGTGRQRRRVVVFFLTASLCFVAYSIFLSFTYGFVFSHYEGIALKDYERYMLPLWLGWMAGAMALLARAAADDRLSPRRLPRMRAARLANLALALCLTAAVGLFFNWQGNFLYPSPARYSDRYSVRELAAQGESAGMAAEHVVYLVSQGDDGTRFHMLGYETKAKLSQLFGGPLSLSDGNFNWTPQFNPDGSPIYHKKAATALVAPGTEAASAYRFATECTADELAAFFRQEGCTHLLLDVADAYFVEAFRPLFGDGLPGWGSDGTWQGGSRYYRISWQNGACLLLPERGDAPQ